MKAKIVAHIKRNSTKYLILVLALFFLFGNFGNPFNNFQGGMQNSAYLESARISDSSVYKGAYDLSLQEFDSKKSYFHIESKKLERDFNNIIVYANNNDFKVKQKNINMRETYQRADIYIQVPKEQSSQIETYLKNNFNIKGHSTNIYNLETSIEQTSTSLMRYEEQIKKYTKLLSDLELSIKQEIELNKRIDELENQIYYTKRELEEKKKEVEFVDISISLTQKPNHFKSISFKSPGELTSQFIQAVANTISLFVYILGYGIIPLIIYLVYRRIKNTKG